MSLFRPSRRHRALVTVAPITDKAGIDRAMRAAVLKARNAGPLSTVFNRQQNFDRALAELVQNIPVSAEIAEWFRNEKLVPNTKRTWRTIIRNPAVVSIALAVAVIAGVAAFNIYERTQEFPGSATARKLLSVAAARGVPYDSINAKAGSLSDLFFMKYRLDHYDVPPEFAGLDVTGARVFDSDEGQRVAQMKVPAERLQFFLFPADRDSKNSEPLTFKGWKYVEHEGWTGAVHEENGVNFMAALRGGRSDLARYIKGDHRSATSKGPDR